MLQLCICKTIYYIYVIYVYLLYTDTVFVTRMKLFNITKYAKLRHYLYAYILTCILCSRYNCLRMKWFHNSPVWTWKWKWYYNNILYIRHNKWQYTNAQNRLIRLFHFTLKFRFKISRQYIFFFLELLLNSSVKLCTSNRKTFNKEKYSLLNFVDVSKFKPVRTLYILYKTDIEFDLEIIDILK